MSTPIITINDLAPYYEALPKVKLILVQYVGKNLLLKEERITGRIKQIDDIMEKIGRKNYPIIIKDDIFNYVCDIAGTRVICDYLSEVEEVKNFICKCPDFKVVEVTDFISNPDCNGYRSCHIDVLVNTVNYTDVKCEIQIRTVTQHSWAEKTHPLVYKKNKSDIPGVACNLLRTLSDQLHTADCFAEDIRKLIKGE